MFAVVDHQQPASGTHQRACDDVDRIGAGRPPGVRRVDEDGSDVVGVVGTGQVDPPHPVAGDGPSDGDLLGQTGLADAAGADERDQAVIIDDSGSPLELSPAANERRPPPRQRACGDLGDAAQRWHPCVQPRGEDLEDVLGHGEVAKGMHTQIEQCAPTDRHVVGERGDHTGDEDLTSVAQLQQPGGAVDRRPEPVVVASLGFAGVHGHPHAKLDGGQRRSRQIALNRHGDSDRVADGIEPGEEPVAGVLDEIAVTALHRSPRDPVVHPQRLAHRVRRGGPQLSRTLDVGEDEHRHAHPAGLYVPP